MNRKIIIGSILVIFTIIAVSFASAAFVQTKAIEKKVSPLYKIRTDSAIDEKIRNLKFNFLRNRILIMPNLITRQQQTPRDILGNKGCSYKSAGCTQFGTCNTFPTMCNPVTCLLGCPPTCGNIACTWSTGSC